MRFNMGCGVNFLEGYLNVDRFPPLKWDHDEPTELFHRWDLERFPWPWDDNCADEILFNHSLEHMGADPAIFCRIMQEVYRISKNNCNIFINVPHPRHDDFINDPTHVRVITPEVLSLFSWKNCEEWKKGGFANSPLAFYYNVDFEVVSAQAVPDEKFVTSRKYFNYYSDLLPHVWNNMLKEYRLTMLAIKPIRQVE